MSRKIIRVQTCAPLLIGTALAFSSMACVNRTFQPTSKSGITTTNIRHTPPKWQSIGNCWLYAVIGWSESLAMYNGRKEDFSESYLTYHYFAEQLLRYNDSSQINTGGTWFKARDLILNYGLMREGDFLPNENGQTYSTTQKTALDYINKSMTSGKLSTDRSEQSVYAELDAAFGVNMNSLKTKVINANEVQVANKRGNAPTKTLLQELNNWTSIYWDLPEAYNDVTQLPKGPFALSKENADLLKRVKRALNDRKPVIMSWYVDFNALDNSGIFSMENLIAKRKPGRQGGHMTVIEDYVAHGTNPATQQPFTTPEGSTSAELKKLALEYGEIDYFVVKNSWGGAERLDRSSYVHDNEKGFTRLNASYIFGAMPMTDEDGATNGGIATSLTEFILPAGY